ncbi:MAG: helix-turn-helix domain-containing protein, partial [Gemmatimonadaceae bacterium]
MTGIPTHQIASNGVFGEPRGRLLTELCGHPQTATELAERVRTSSNAVRVHLDALREAGLVAFTVERRGVGKPTHVYALTEAAEYVLSAAYAPALRAILATLRQERDGGLAAWLRGAGATLTRQQWPSAPHPDTIDSALG